MVAQLLRLRLTLSLGAFRRAGVQAVGVGIAVFAGLAVTAVVSVWLVGLRDETADIARASIVVAGALILLAFFVFPLAFEADDPLDPRQFRLLGLGTGRLAFGLAVAAFASLPALLLACVAVAQVVAWSRGGLPTLLAIASAVLLLPTAVLTARISGGLAASFLSSRPARSAGVIVLMAAAAVLAPLAAMTSTLHWESQGIPVLRRITAVLGWTPLGAVWSVPADAAIGRTGDALAKLGIAAATVLVLALLWRLLVGWMLRRRDRKIAARNYSGLGWFERVPATPRGVITARSMSYLLRDPRYGVALAAIPVVPIIVVAALVIGGVPVEVIAWLPVPLMCLFLGWSVHNDLAHDSSAFWVHVSANTRGSDDRWGRVMPALLLGLPVALLGSLATALIMDDWIMLPGLAGVSICILLVGLGVSSAASALVPYPAVHPGGSAFAQPVAAGNSGSTVQAVSLLLTILLASPPAVLSLLGVLLSDPMWFSLALLSGVLVGVGLLLLGVRIGSVIVAKRAPELLAFTLQN